MTWFEPDDARRRLIDRGDGTAARLTGGPVQAVPAPFMNLDPMALHRPGEHLWVMVAAWRIAEPAEAFDPGIKKFLDLENLLSVDGPGCYICEQVYDAATALTPCPGEPH